jgi:hypothetical protein
MNTYATKDIPAVPTGMDINLPTMAAECTITTEPEVAMDIDQPPADTSHLLDADKEVLRTNETDMETVFMGMTDPVSQLASSHAPPANPDELDSSELDESTMMQLTLEPEVDEETMQNIHLAGR